jgi:hypothetical protein
VVVFPFVLLFLTYITLFELEGVNQREVVMGELRMMTIMTFIPFVVCI